MDDQLRKQAAQIVAALPKLMRQLFTLDEGDPSTKLPLAQIRVCTLLNDGPLAMSAVSNELGISLSAMTQVADRLERAGLVERIPQPGDRRIKLLQLTPAAREMVRLRDERRVKRVLEVVCNLAADERADIVDALNLLVTASSAPGSKAAGTEPDKD